MNTTGKKAIDLTIQIIPPQNIGREFQDKGMLGFVALHLNHENNDYSKLARPLYNMLDSESWEWTFVEREQGSSTVTMGTYNREPRFQGTWTCPKEDSANKSFTYKGITYQDLALTAIKASCILHCYRNYDEYEDLLA